MLSATLRDFVRDGLVQRRPDTRYVPQRVDYSLTELGMTFCKTIARAAPSGYAGGKSPLLNHHWCSCWPPGCG
jgi:HxlR-like helix-turn-helix